MKRWIMASLLAFVAAQVWQTAPAAAQAVPLEVTIEVELGKDLGQPLGSLFEARDATGRVVFGAGFEDGHSTYVRDNNRQLVLYCKAVSHPVSVTPVGKPYGTEHNAARLLADRQGLVTFKRYGDPVAFFTAAGGGLQPYTPTWLENPPGFCGLQYVDNRPLVFLGDRITYDGKTVYQSERGAGMYYYALGTLLIFHHEPQTIYALPWDPASGTPVSLGNAKAFPIEGSVFVYGCYGDELHLVTNVGNYYVYARGDLERIRASDGKSWQAYSMVHVYDDLFIGQYPTGSIFTYNAEGLRLLDPPIPVPDGVSANAREAQTLAIHGGYVYAGVWPWGEVWRYDPDVRAWEFVARVFDSPPLSTTDQEPYATAMKDKRDVYNYWGQRVTSLTNVGDALYIATMNKQGRPYVAGEHDFLTPGEVAQYGRIHRLESRSQIAVPFEWKPDTQFRFVCAANALEVYQDGTLIGKTAIKAEDVQGPLDVHKGSGIYGPFAGTIH